MSNSPCLVGEVLLFQLPYLDALEASIEGKSIVKDNGCAEGEQLLDATHERLSLAVELLFFLGFFDHFVMLDDEALTDMDRRIDKSLVHVIIPHGKLSMLLAIVDINEASPVLEINLSIVVGHEFIVLLFEHFVIVFLHHLIVSIVFHQPVLRIFPHRDLATGPRWSINLSPDADIASGETTPFCIFSKRLFVPRNSKKSRILTNYSNCGPYTGSVNSTPNNGSGSELS